MSMTLQSSSTKHLDEVAAVEEYRNMCWSMARKFWQGNRHVCLEDMFQEGRIAALIALRTASGRSDQSLKSYVRVAVKNAMRKCIYSQRAIVREPDDITMVRRYMRERYITLEYRLCREPRAEDFFSSFQQDPPTSRLTWLKGRAVSPHIYRIENIRLALERPDGFECGDLDLLTLDEEPFAGKVEADSICDRVIINEALSSLLPHWRFILCAVVAGYEPSQIAPFVGCSVKSVAELASRARRKVREYLRKRDFEPF